MALSLSSVIRAWELLLLTWLPSLSTRFSAPCLHKYAFYVHGVVKILACRDTENDLYQFLLVCLSLSTQMLAAWCNNCTGVCYRGFKVALTRRKDYSHCILQRSLWQVFAQIQEWCWPWPCFALYKLYKVLSWSCSCVCAYVLATDERELTALLLNTRFHCKAHSFLRCLDYKYWIWLLAPIKSGVPFL